MFEDILEVAIGSGSLLCLAFLSVRCATALRPASTNRVRSWTNTAAQRTTWTTNIWPYANTLFGIARH